MIYIVIFNLNVLFLLKYVVDYLCLFREERVFTDPGSALSYLLSLICLLLFPADSRICIHWSHRFFTFLYSCGNSLKMPVR